MDDAPLIAAPLLLERLTAGERWVLLDCGFDLADPAAGQRAFDAGHLPGALYAHLDQHLSGPKTGNTAQGGRHPLPDRAAFAETLGRWGVEPGVPVVCYDAQGGPYAARAWWLLKWAGHEPVCVLDGGKAALESAWTANGGALTTEASAVVALPPYPAPYPARGPGMPTIDADSLQASLGRVLLIDARAPERFRGDVEPLDPVAGHIPGASNRFFKDNLAADGRFKPAEELRATFEALGAAAADRVVHQCGSGVTACHNLLAMVHAGFELGVLYPGSWSEWCADAARPVARG